jgi:hypothetical protein
MDKKFDLSNLRLDETGRVELSEKQLSEIDPTQNDTAGGRDILDEIWEWWNTNFGNCTNRGRCEGESNPSFCTNEAICYDSTNKTDCSNGIDCSDSTNDGECANGAYCGA